MPFPGDRILADRYELLEPITEGNSSIGSPMLWRVSDGASLAFAKIWRLGPSGPEIESIWTHETRNLLRLGGLPRSDEVFVRLRDVGIDPIGPVVVLNGDGREPLAAMLKTRARWPWLHDLQSARVRRRLWDGLARIARGLAMLHAEGTLHRSLRAESIFTDPEGACDFRLSGFEWSLRVAPPGDVDGVVGTERDAPELDGIAAQFSIASDWFSFGILCAELIGGLRLPENGEDPARSIRDRLSRATATAQEKRLIQDLVDPDPDRRMWHTSELTEAIGEIVDALTGDREKRPLYVGFDLGRDSKLAKLVARTATPPILLRDSDALLEFVTTDLGRQPAISVRSQPFVHYILHGEKIDYQLRPTTGGSGSNSLPSWEAASSLQHDVHQTEPLDRTHHRHNRRIEPRTSAWVAANRRSISSLGESWDEAIPLRDDEGRLSEEQTRVIGFFDLTNQLEALLILSEIWPVRVLATREEDGALRADVTPVEEPDRNRMALLIGMPTPAEQMRRLFQLDETLGRRAAEQMFVLEDDGRLNRRDGPKKAHWRFVAHRNDERGPLYTFVQEFPDIAAPRGDMFLRPADLAGSSVLLTRRKDAIRGLRAHGPILDAIDDPAVAKRTTIDVLRDGPSVLDLDESKRTALREIWSSQPLYMLQGPPGTGKTTLVAALTAETARTSPSAQLLITAQAHSTVDTVMDEVVEALGPDTPFLAVRLDSDGNHGAAATAEDLSTQLAVSPFAKQAPGRIRERLMTMAYDLSSAGRSERSGFERLVEHGAGVIFATTNSGDLARLLDEGRRYDRSIIEEAGRAHGFDLALPIRASHRVLMIGDHQQLPAFNLSILDKLLQDPKHLQEALAFGSRYAPSLIGRHAVRGIAAEPARFADDCRSWRTLLPFFKTIFDRCELAGSLDGETIARQLTLQHRMHPHIAAIVRRCFYPRLRTAPSAIRRFVREPDPFMSKPGGWLPEARIVFIDVPWIQRGRHARGESAIPRYSSGVEIDATVAVLQQLRRADPEGPTPTLQVLSPYRAQLKRLKRALNKEEAHGSLSELNGFDLRGVDGGVGATVDEFQGNQADVIIVSLVRNNHAKRGRGLGILADGRRWNVLLSRAKRKLVLIGSFDFFASRITPGAVLHPDDPMADLARVVEVLGQAFETGRAVRIPFDSAMRSTAGEDTTRRHRRNRRYGRSR